MVCLEKQRKMIDSFRMMKITFNFYIITESGGVGLNLTRASHVVHFDRWWNPAVENQLLTGLSVLTEKECAGTQVYMLGNSRGTY